MDTSPSKSRTLYDFSAPNKSGEPLSLADFRGKVVLVVNTASKCGFTPQYAGLEQLYKDYGDKGLVVLAFPSNQFGAQEPGSDDEIESFCQINYGVTFPVFAKGDVNGPDAWPVFDWLRTEAPGLLGTTAIKWNFTKFLVDREGRVVERFAPTTGPESLRPAIEKLL